MTPTAMNMSGRCATTLILLLSFVVFLNTYFVRELSQDSVRLKPKPDAIIGTNDGTGLGTDRVIQAKDSANNYQCIALESEFEGLLKDTDRTFILMAAKAGGSSVKVFAGECMGKANQRNNMDFFVNNFIDSNMQLQPFLLSTLNPPQLVASHIHDARPLIELMRYSTQKTMIIYVYREETDRMASAIGFVARDRLCRSGVQPQLVPGRFQESLPKLGLRVTKNSCTMDEAPFVEEIVKKKFVEIGYMIGEQLSCEVWDEIDRQGPRILFVHYKQLDALQTQLALHYCPEVHSKRENLKPGNNPMDNSTFKHFIKLNSTGEDVLLEDWVKAKKTSFEFTLKISGGDCKHTIRKMDRALAQCPDKVLRMFPRL